MIGRTISHYRIVSQLGAGGMGVVYGAEDVRLGRPVALKFVPETLARDRQAVDRFQVEARAASALNHPNICTIYDIGEDEGRPFIVMELMKGQTLRDRLASGPLKLHQLVDIGIQIADALDAAHGQGIVHRDIKPANLFLTDRGQVKILDFGLAKLSARHAVSRTTVTAPAPDQLTVPGITLGTVSYMSPEQAAGEEIDGRTDLFSFGVVLYECSTGRRPFTGNTSAVILAAILNREHVAPAVFNPDMPLRLQEVVNNCLEKDRELRYQTAADLRADLKRVRRDLESGHSGIRSATAPPSLINAAAGGADGPTQSSGHAPSPAPSRQSPGASASGASPGRSRRLFLGVAIATVALTAATSYWRWPRAPTSPATTTGAVDAQSQSEAIVQNRLELAMTSLKARNYRAALAYAGEVLAAVPDHAEATKVRDQARAVVARFDQAIADARRLAAAGEAEGAARALDEARSIDPTDPGVADLSARLAERFRIQTEAANRELRRSRAATGPPTSARTGRPDEPARSEARREGTSAVSPLPASPSSVIPSPPSPVPREDAPPAAVQPLPAPTGAASAAQSASPESVTRPPKSSSPPPPAPVERREHDQAASTALSTEDDESAIRRVVATYQRAIETKDLALFRSVKPNLSREEERRIEEGFRAVSSQQVSVSILSIERRGQDASVRLKRRDTIEAGGQRQTAESQQTMTLARTGGGWVIVEIGR
jgi:serine/threonine protein kinase